MFKIIQWGLAVAFIATAGLPAEAQGVKKSSSGICHCPGGQFYDRTTNFTELDSLDACLSSGGREPLRGQGNCSAVSPSRDSPTEPRQYDRSVFGGWADEDQDCQNTRHERLIARSDPVELSEDGCQVLSGRWIDPYTGNTHTSAQALEIDHVVPLLRLGTWGKPMGLGEATVNRSKGAASPLDWLPPSEAFACEYLLRFVRVVDRYELQLQPDETDAFEQLTAQRCDYD